MATYSFKLVALVGALAVAGAACAQDLPSLPPGVSATPAQRAHVPMRQRFAELDVDHDGALTLAEIGDRAPHLAKHFQRLDLNGDGRLTRDELRQAHLAHKAERAARQQQGAPLPQL